MTSEDLQDSKPSFRKAARTSIPFLDTAETARITEHWLNSYPLERLCGTQSGVFSCCISRLFAFVHSTVKTSSAQGAPCFHPPTPRHDLDDLLFSAFSDHKTIALTLHFSQRSLRSHFLYGGVLRASFRSGRIGRMLAVFSSRRKYLEEERGGLFSAARAERTLPSPRLKYLLTAKTTR